VTEKPAVPDTLVWVRNRRVPIEQSLCPLAAMIFANSHGGYSDLPLSKSRNDAVD
jgi:hypothetical protein